MSDALKKLNDYRRKIDNGDLEDILWAVADGGAGFDSISSSVVLSVHFMRAAFGYKEKDDTRVPNPYFLACSFEGPSPATLKYFAHRKKVNVASAATSVGSSLATGVTMVDTVGVAQAGNAMGSTAAHMVGVLAAGAKFKKSAKVTAWIDAIIKAKAAKMGVRTASMVASAVPVPAVGLSFAAAAAVAKLGIRVGMHTLIRRTAMEIHWRAFQEIQVARKGGPVGPASSIFYEIFTRRGVTRLFGKHETEALIREPCGWEALADKLLMM